METYISYARLNNIVNNIENKTISFNRININNKVPHFDGINIHKRESGSKFNKNSKACDVYLLEINGSIVGQIRKCPMIGTVEYRLSYKNIPKSGCFNPTKRNMKIFQTYNYNYLPWLDIHTKQQERITYQEIEQKFPSESISHNAEKNEITEKAEEVLLESPVLPIPPVLESVLPVSSESPVPPVSSEKKSAWQRFKGVFSRKKKGGKRSKKTMRNNCKNKRTKKQRK